ncbi:hypothetical protein NOX80_11255 [Flavobacterium cerinum]|uniref:Helix-turn-helix domain-containing protein n=1 Tax=Flavobacterium cerinum TaxID=2502784 RepID=A0ABY5IS60_9FLAO|nr:hypothetical protein [Flavobacterium cerinum]UUC44209.1 hypothetical protein NOX80_11255 [Flavobacterium cerinum]
MHELNPLTEFFLSIKNDGRISITHIAIYAAILDFRIKSGFDNPIQVFSYQIMEIAKISAGATYRKCIKDLSEFGYIRYVPSFKNNQASKIYFV